MKLDENGMLTDLPEDLANAILYGDGRMEPVNKLHVLTKDDIKDIDPGDDVSVHITKTIEHTISLVREDQDKFIFECITPFLTEINHIVIPKRVLERALTTFREEHTAEWEALMKEYGGTGV